MTFISESKALFKTSCLYDILGLDKSARSTLKPAEIKKAYYKASLVYHPDRCQTTNQILATKKFQILSKAYSILSNKKSKANYDETGEIDDESLDTENDKDWLAYWRLLFKKVTVDDIKQFEKNYKNSDEEKADLKAAYLQFEGDMDQIMDSILCSTIEDEERFRKMINDMIKDKEIPAFDSFTKETKKKRTNRRNKAMKEAKEAEQMAAELTGKNGLDEKQLENAIIEKANKRGRQMDAFLDGLAEKYAPSKKAKAAKKTQPKKKTARK